MLDNRRLHAIENKGGRKGGAGRDAMRRCLLVVMLVTFIFARAAWAADDNGFISALEDSPLAEKAVAKYLNVFTDDLKKPFSLWLARSNRYVSVMEHILSENDIPKDIVFLSMIESGFNPYAYSRARAVGPWQFVSATAKRYGLKINWWIDERRDPIKSTMAAAMYLRDLHNMFGSWGLAMAAYNAGEGAVKRAVEKVGEDSYWELCQTRGLRNETKQYVPKFLAARTIALDPEGHGFANIVYEGDFSYDEVVLWQPLDLEVAARCAGVGVGEIRALNPEITRWCTPLDVKSYILRVPKNTLMVFLENLSKLTPAERLPLRSYAARRRDTLSRIARRFRLPVSVIEELNNFKTRRQRIRSGQKILLPPSGEYRSSYIVASR